MKTAWCPILSDEPQPLPPQEKRGSVVPIFSARKEEPYSTDSSED